MTWTLTLLSLTAASLIWYLYQSQPKICRAGKRLRRPPNTLPILGNALHFLKPRHELFSWFIDCQRIFGEETFEIAVPSLPPGVVINSPENLEYVLKNEASISKGEFFRERSWDLFGRMARFLLSDLYWWVSDIFLTRLEYQATESSTPRASFGKHNVKLG